MLQKKVIDFNDLKINPKTNIPFLSLEARQKVVVKGDLGDLKVRPQLEVYNKKPMDIYAELKGLRSDLDLYAYHEDIELLASVPYASSTRPGVESEALFTRQAKEKSTILSIFQNAPHSWLKNDRRFKIVISSFKTGRNPNLLEPNDPGYLQQWYLFNGGFVDTANASSAVLNHDIGAPEAWKEHVGSRRVITAVIDTGVDLKHPDLIDNLWANKLELNGKPDVDDDLNGYTDDVYGWSFAQSGSGDEVAAINADWSVLKAPGSRGEPNGAPRFTQEKSGISHGTHVAGIIGASGNNGFGVSGVNWKANLMALNAATDQNSFPDSLLVEALHYALDNGAKVINLSLGQIWKMGSKELSALRDDEFEDDRLSGFKLSRRMYRKVLDKASEKDALIVYAVGNEGDGQGDTQNWDQAGHVNHVSSNNPWSLFDGHPNLISVASVDPDRRLSPYSNFGSSVDIAAPGGNSSKSQYFTDPITGRVLSSLVSNYGILSTVLPSSYGSELSDYDYVPKAMGEYQKYNGTSMAAPVVSGAATLIWSKFPDLSAAEVKQSLLESATFNPYLVGYVNDGRDLNLGAAMQFAKGLNAIDSAEASTS